MNSFRLKGIWRGTPIICTFKDGTLTTTDPVFDSELATIVELGEPYPAATALEERLPSLVDADSALALLEAMLDRIIRIEPPTEVAV